MNELLSPAAETMVYLLGNFGCMSKAQAKAIFEDRAQRIASALVLKNIIKEKEEIYVPVHTPKPDKLMIDCLWVALNKVKKEDGTYDTEPLRFATQNKPVLIGLIANNMFYNIVGITQDNIYSTLTFLNDRYSKNQKAEDGMEYILVVRNEDLIDQILEIEPSIPYRIVLLDGDGEFGPKVKYLKK